MQIKIEKIESQNVLNFYLPQILLPTGKLVVQNKATEANSLADRILNIAGITRCMIAAEVVSVQFNPENYEEVKALVMAEIDDFITDEESLFLSSQMQLSLLEQAEAVADAFIRPTLNRDNGDIVLHAISNNVLELSFTGHCAGCPYAQNTLQNIIIRTFQRYMPQIREVHLKG